MAKSDLEELYQEVIIDHYRNPRCRGTCETPSATYEAYNPLCGDRVNISLTINEAGIVTICFDGSGCSISQAAASLMAELCSGKTAAEIKELYTVYQDMILEDVAPEEIHRLKDAAVLRGIRKFPARYRCALLSWQALDAALKQL